MTDETMTPFMYRTIGTAMVVAYALVIYFGQPTPQYSVMLCLRNNVTISPIESSRLQRCVFYDGMEITFGKTRNNVLPAGTIIRVYAHD